MFERYTEKARRVIFFARYEASQFGSPEIQPEHLLLGLMRENRSLFRSVGEPGGSLFVEFRELLEAGANHSAVIHTSVDLPLSEDAKRCLFVAAEEAQELGHQHIGSDHLLLGILRVKSSPAAQFLERQGMSAAALRKELGSSGSADTRMTVGAGGQPAMRPLAVALPLSAESVHLVAFAMEEAEALGHTKVEPAHLLLGLLRQRPSGTADLLRRRDSRRRSCGIALGKRERFTRRTEGRNGQRDFSSEADRPRVSSKRERSGEATWHTAIR